MTKPDTKFKEGNKGRPKGAKGKFTTFKDALYDVFEQKGGVEGLLTWASKPENEKQFYEFMAKMLPKEVNLTGDADSPVGVVLLPEKKES